MISQPPQLIPASEWLCHSDAWRAILVDYFCSRRPRGPIRCT
jgi:hypothetical protein